MSFLRRLLDNLGGSASQEHAAASSEEAVPLPQMPIINLSREQANALGGDEVRRILGGDLPEERAHRLFDVVLSMYLMMEMNLERLENGLNDMYHGLFTTAEAKRLHSFLLCWLEAKDRGLNREDIQRATDGYYSLAEG